MDIKEFIGKHVLITVNSGSKYRGYLYRRGKEKIILAYVCPLYDGLYSRITPQAKRNRIFRLDNVAHIRLTTREDFEREWSELINLPEVTNNASKESKESSSTSHT